MLTFIIILCFALIIIKAIYEVSRQVKKNMSYSQQQLNKNKVMRMMEKAKK